VHTLHTSKDTRKSLELRLSDDRLKLFAHIEPAEEIQALTADDLLLEISTVCRADFVDADVVRDIVAKLHVGVTCDERRIAKGKDPIEGRDGKIVWLIRRFSAKPDNEKGEQEFADFFHLGLFENVRTGQEIARVYKPKNGKAGIDVTGREIPARNGKPASFKLDKSATLKTSPKPDGYDLIISNLNGYAREDGGTISVREVLEVPGHVDYSLGHIDFIGSVKISGDVNKGFNVKARGSIEVAGSVHGENQIVSDAAVTIKGFHQGGPKSSLYAAGDYSVGVAHQITGQVKGKMSVKKEALECTLRVTRGVFGPEAAIVGGILQIVSGLEAAHLGNSASMATVIEFRSDFEVTEEFVDLEALIQQHQAGIDLLSLHLGPYAQNRARITHLKGVYRDKILTLVHKYDQLATSLVALQARKKTMLEEAQGVQNPTAQVNATKTLHGGVVLRKSESFFTCNDDTPGPVTVEWNAERGEWSVVSYKELPNVDEGEKS